MLEPSEEPSKTHFNLCTKRPAGGLKEEIVWVLLHGPYPG
jgi:hypothetical protein